MSFFRVENGKLKYDKDYILMNSPFKEIIDKYGDNKADPYFKYIYEIADNRSYSNKQALSKEKAHKHACMLAGFEESYKPDTVVNNAIKYYKKYNYNLHADTLKQLRYTLEQIKKINSKIRSAIDSKLDKDEELEANDISNLINLQAKLFEMIDKLPGKIESIKNLEVKVYQELEREKELGRGGIPIPDSYDGDPEIEATL